MTMQQLNYFLILARYEHMAMSADFLNISQPALSKSIASLENELGCTLFDRTGTTIKLNHCGNLFRDHIQTAFRTIDQGISKVHASTYEISGDIRIAGSAFFPSIIPLISEYVSLNPLVNFTLSQNYIGNLDPRLGMGNELIFCTMQLNKDVNSNSQYWTCQHLFFDEYALAISEKYTNYDKIKIYDEYVDLTSFSRERFIMSQNIDFMKPDYTTLITHNAGFMPQSYFKTDDFFLTLSLISQGLSVAIVPYSSAIYIKQLGIDIKLFKILNYNSRHSVYMMRKKKILMSEQSLDFWDFMLDYYNLPSDDRQ